MKTPATILALGLASFALHLSPSFLHPQSQAADITGPKFTPFVYDVVSIKYEAKSSNLTPFAVETPDGYSQQHLGIQGLIYRAYHAAKYTRLNLGASWISLDFYQIQAKMSPEVAEAFSRLSPSDQKIARQHMYQQLLKDYLKISVHLESQEVPAFELRVGKHRPSFKEITDAAVPDEGIVCYGQSDGSMICKGRATTLASLVQQMQGRFGRPVFDKTGLTGRYEYSFRFAQGWIPMGPTASADPDAASPSDAPDFVAAVKSQLGLIVVATTALVDIVVVDHIERPATN